MSEHTKLSYSAPFSLSLSRPPIPDTTPVPRNPKMSSTGVTAAIQQTFYSNSLSMLLPMLILAQKSPPSYAHMKAQPRLRPT